MGPKKAAAETLISPPKSSEKEEPEKVKSSEVSEGVVKAPRKPSSRPTTLEMVKEALKALDSRKGVSVQAIRSFIREKYPTVDEVRVKGMVRRALNKGLESGAFVRPGNSTMTGAVGRFRLAVRKTKEAKPAKKAQEAKENANPNVAKAKEPKAKGAGAEKAKSVKRTKSANEDSKPQKARKDAARSKQDSTGSKVQPAKKPKAKKVEGAKDKEEEPKTQKRTKGTKAGSDGGDAGKAVSKKGGKKVAEKAEEPRNKGTEAAAPKMGGKKAEDGGKKAPSKGEDGGGEEAAAAAPKATGRKGKKAAEK